MATMLFTLLLLCSSAFGAIYQRFEQLPTRNFDFIIIGGRFFRLRYTFSDLDTFKAELQGMFSQTV